MKKLSRESLKRIIKLEMKHLMDEDALFRDHDIPGNDDRYNDYSLQSMESDCDCGSCSSCDDDLYDMNTQYADVDFKDEKHHKSSSYMARPQLSKIAKYAAHLLDMIDEGEELQDWQESKIAQMSQMMGDVYHSIEYDEEYSEHHEDDVDIHDLIGMIRSGNI